MCNQTQQVTDFQLSSYSGYDVCTCSVKAPLSMVCKVKIGEDEEFLAKMKKTVADPGGRGGHFAPAL